jgi:peptidyl-prolyl cis-trans isomerase D
MLKTIQQRDQDRNRWVKVAMAVILGIIIFTMVITLIPGLMNGTTDQASSPDTIASVGDKSISIVDFQQEYEQDMRNQQVPPMLAPVYKKQVLDAMIFQRALEYEGDRLGIRVTPEEQTERIKELLPTAWSGSTWLRDRYPAEVQAKYQMSVEQFESLLKDAMLQDKFHQMVTDGITVTPQEIAQEFMWRNDKIKIDYVVVKPGDLASTIHPSDADLSAYFTKNSAKYQLPQRRSARYALLDLGKLRAGTQVDDATLRAYYNQHIDEYKVENRVHVEHILFKTIGKTDAETAEIRQKAEDVLKQAKHGGNFEDLAKKNSEDDATKAKGGDLGWIVEGQTVPEFQQVAFSLPKGQISDLVKTQYGFHIIKVIDHENAHTRPFEEVRDSILQPVLEQKVNTEANDISNQMAAAVRQSNRQSIDDIARKFNLETGDSALVAQTDPILPLGTSPELHAALFSLRAGELSQPIQIESGFVIVTPKEIQQAHQAMLDEVKDRVIADYQKEKALDLARNRAADLAKQAQGGADFAKTAKSLDLTVKSSDSFARAGSIPDVGTAKPFGAAFKMANGQVGGPVLTGENWVVYRVVAHDVPNPDDLAKQRDDIQQQLLQNKQGAAFEAFHKELIDRLTKEKKLNINAQVERQATSS